MRARPTGRPFIRQHVLLVSLWALTSLACADILGLDRGHLASDAEAREDSGQLRDGAVGAGGADAADDGRPGDAPMDSGDRGGNAGATGDGAGSGGTDASGGSGGADASGGRGGAGVPDASAGSGGGGAGPVDAGLDRGPTCAAGQKLCNGGCVASNDPAYGCDEAACTACVFPNATAVCSTSGQCAIGTCSQGFGNCVTNDPKDGCETDFSKAETCGSCTTKCNASAPLCTGSNGSYQCVSGCTAPASTLCGSQCVDINTNATHCGDCATACMSPANGEGLCANKACDYTCHSAYHKCTATRTCASDTDVNACGDTCKKCEAPANGKVSCTSGDCAVSCNTNYHLCGATCADDNSPATCGTACSACLPPADPNADPAPTCVNKQCGFKCEAGYNLCGGVCSDTNSIQACGPTCTVCEKPANASAAICNGTTCGFTCNAGYEPSGTQCVVATNLYVATSGADTNQGTQASPFRTWKRAAQIAQSGTIVNFAAGSYNAAGGDDFADAIPNGVTLQRNGTGTVTFAGDGVHSLVFAGSGTVTNIALTNFKAPLMASAGTQTVKGVTISGCTSPVQATGTAVMVISDSSSISGAPTERILSSEVPALVRVDAAAHLTIRDTTISGSWAECLGTVSAGTGVLAIASSTLTLANMTFNGYLWQPVWASASAEVTLTNSSVLSSCGYGLRAEDNVSVTATNTTFADIVVMGGANLTVSGGGVKPTGNNTLLQGTGKRSFRGCGFEGLVQIADSPNYDFGTNTSAGTNTFSGGISLTAEGVNIPAYGNKWIPNVQGADANGYMPSALIMGPVAGANVTISSASSSVSM